MARIRCAWVGEDSLMIDYHDNEWGVPVHDDQKLFEFMTLDAFQAGLSWRIVLNKREGFRRALDRFNPVKIAEYSQDDVERLVNDSGIVRNRQKISATINNAKLFLETQRKYGSFDAYIWRFVDSKPLINAWKTDSQIPVVSQEAEAMSKDLINKGFKFVGPTICYAIMQAAGLVNDHVTRCFRYSEVTKKR